MSSALEETIKNSTFSESCKEQILKTLRMGEDLQRTAKRIMADRGGLNVEFHTPEHWLIIKIDEDVLFVKHWEGDKYHRDETLRNFQTMLDTIGVDYDTNP